MIQAPNRQGIPRVKPVQKIDYIRAEEVILSNGIPLYLINAGTQDIVRIELFFKAGSRVETVPLVASATNAMLSEGTEKRTSEMIAESFEYYGAYFQLNADKDNGTVVLFTLAKYLEQTLEIVADILLHSTFPDKEFQTYIRKAEQQFIEEQGKVKTIARTGFLKAIFGNDHPYGREIVVQDFHRVTFSMLADFYHNHYRNRPFCIIVSGKLWTGMDNIIDHYFGENRIIEFYPLENASLQLPDRDPEKVFIEKEKVFQSAIRIGKKLFNKHHPDFAAMQLLNTILGGYFGSRLMKNIREDKGYTYGIGSMILSMHHAGYFVIASEVGKEVCRAALEEIYKEINILRETIIPEAELTVVKHYLMGKMVRMFDGPFAQAESLKAIIEYGLDYDYYDKAIDTIKNTTGKQLLDLANQYFASGTFTEIVAGKY
jgi:zinc protease